MSQITPFLWFENEAEDAAKFYVSVFKNSHIGNVSRYGEAGPLPAGTAMVVEFTLDGQDFMALNGGSSDFAEGHGRVTLFANCDTQDEVGDLWEKLGKGGEYLPCGWLRDKYGIAWNIVPKGLVELIGSDDAERQQRAMQAMLQMGKLDINELRRAYDGVPAP